MPQPGGIAFLASGAAICHGIDRAVGAAEIGQFVAKINPQAVPQNSLLILDRNRCQRSRIH
jgi:hypothetical protein